MVTEAEDARAEPKARIFISYSRKDISFADRLEEALKARGFEALIDRYRNQTPSEDRWNRIQALISRADTVVFCFRLLPAVASDVALEEVAHAVSLNKRFAPVVCRAVDDNAVPEALRRLNFIFFNEQERFEESADGLAEALRTDIGWVRQHTEYGDAARHWSRAGRPAGLLLRSPTLEEAQRLIASRPHSAPLRAHQRWRLGCRTSSMIPRGSTARRSIANSIPPSWLSSRRRYRHTESRDVTIIYLAFNRRNLAGNCDCRFWPIASIVPRAPYVRSEELSRHVKAAVDPPKIDVQRKLPSRRGAAGLRARTKGIR